MITLGGNAELELVDSMDPFSEGIIFSVMPPKKSWRNISNLSGGEKVAQFTFLLDPHFLILLSTKTLSSLALVFALHVYKVCTTRFCMFLTSDGTTRSQRHCTSWMRLMLL
jgi:structural maintenance of chromosome 4